jgi:hypothetical protein
MPTRLRTFLAGLKGRRFQLPSAPAGIAGDTWRVCWRRTKAWPTLRPDQASAVLAVSSRRLVALQAAFRAASMAATAAA